PPPSSSPSAGSVCPSAVCGSGSFSGVRSAVQAALVSASARPARTAATRVVLVDIVHALSVESSMSPPFRRRGVAAGEGWVGPRLGPFVVSGNIQRGRDRDKVPGDPSARAPGSGRAPAPVTASVLDHLGDDLVRGLVRRRALTLDADRHLGEQRGDRPDGHEYRRDGGRHRGDGEARGERDLEQGLPRVVLDEDAADVALPDELAHLRDERVTGDLELLVPRPAVAGLGHLLPLSVDGEARMTDRAAPTRITRREQDPSLGRDPALGGRGRVARPAATPRGPRGPTRTTAR